MKDGKLDLEVFAVNGVLVSDASVPKDSAGRAIIAAGDNVTYRLRYNLSQGDFNNLKLEGFLPDPIFQANDPDQDGTASGYTGVTPTSRQRADNRRRHGGQQLGPGRHLPARTRRTTRPMSRWQHPS